jgi:hypothetical protein
VGTLEIQGDHELITSEEDMGSAQWLELFQPFTHVTRVNVWGEQFVPGVVQALIAGEIATEVLPELTSLYLSGYRGSPSVEKAAEQFVATRGLSGREVHLFC